MIVHLPENLEDSLRAEVSGGRFASVDDAVAEAVRRLLQGQKNDQPDVESNASIASDPVIGAMRNAADELDEIVEDAMQRRWSAGWHGFRTRTP